VPAGHQQLGAHGEGRAAHPAVDDHLTDREDGHRTGGVASAGGRCTHVTATLNAAAVLP
jgi:hypothetical protein